MKQKFFSVILSDGRDASPNLLHQFYGLLTQWQVARLCRSFQVLDTMRSCCMLPA